MNEPRRSPRFSCQFDKLLKKNVPHILETIFFSLDCKSFGNCLKVNKEWNKLLRSESFKTKVKSGRSALKREICTKVFLAAGKGSLEEVKRLLATGMVDVNYYYCGKVELPLYKSTAWIEVDDMDERSALHYAVLTRRNKVVQLLLEAGSDPDKMNNRGLTPLLLAQHLGRTDMVKMMKSHING